MTLTEDDYQNLVINYLISNPHLICNLPISIYQVLDSISFTSQYCQATVQHLQLLDLACQSLSSILCSNFVYIDKKIEYFDFCVLQQWLYPRQPEQPQEFPHELISYILDDSSVLNNQRSEIENLINSPTSKTILSKERAIISKPAKPFVDICQSSSRHECLMNGKLDCINKIHFEPIITSNTDTKIGDCSYLDTCYKGKGCKYVHYRIVYPEIVTANASNAASIHQSSHSSLVTKEHYYSCGERMANAIYSELPPQWICCDIRKLDLRVLGQFAAIIADPPWDIHMNGHVQLPFGVITDEEILAFQIDKIQNEGVFFLWVTGRALDIGRQCMKNWGYTHVEEIIWCKTNQLGRTICTGRTGHWLNHSKEHVLMGIKGSPEWLNRGMDIDTIVSATRDKSHKPDELYDIIERLVGPTARKLELFGREHNIRPQWLTVGSELDGTRLIEPDIAQQFHQWRLSNGA